MDNGKLIVIEGIDKAGKETQSHLLYRYLIDKLGVLNVFLFEFPNYSSSSNSGQLIKDYLMGKQKFSQRTINMIYSVNRYEMRESMQRLLNIYSVNKYEMRESTQRLLNEGYVIICDRYYYSNMAYGSGTEQTMEEIEAMDSEMPQPDLVILIDISAEESLKRSGKDADKNERNLKLLKEVRQNYQNLFLEYDKWVQVNGEEDKQEIHEQIVTIVENRLFNNKK